jgi:hypothetical protein
MIRLLRSVFFLVILLFLALTFAYANPRAFIDQPDFDAGEVLKGKEIVHEFILKNTGDEPLLLKEIKRC